MLFWFLGLIIELPEGAFRYTSMYIAYKLGSRYYFDGYNQLTRSILRYSWGCLPTLLTNFDRFDMPSVKPFSSIL